MGFGDLICVLMILFTAIFPEQWVMYGAGYLIFKGGLFGFLGDFASYFDVFSGFYMIFLSFGLSHAIISVIVLLFLFQKAAASWF